MYSKEETFITALDECDIQGARVLLAGGGRRSARSVIDSSPDFLTVACVPDDPEIAKRIINELGGTRNDAEVIQVDISKRGVFKNASYDLVICDYLISKLDIFAPRKHIDVLQNIYGYLKPGGKIVLIDIEPEAPPGFGLNFSNPEIDMIANNQLDVETELDNFSRYRFYQRVRKFVIDMSLYQGTPGFRELPGDWVEKWLISIGFVNVVPKLTSRLLQAELNDQWESRMRKLINVIDDAKLRKYIEALMDRSEALLREVIPFNFEQDVYIISGRKK